MRVVNGGGLSGRDGVGSVPVAMVNEYFVSRYLPPGSDPLTQRIAVDQPNPGVPRNAPPVKLQIIGVFHNVRTGGLRNDDYPEIDVPFWQSPWPQAAMAVRTTGDPEAMTKIIAAAVMSIDSELPLADVRTMDQ